MMHVRKIADSGVPIEYLLHRISPDLNALAGQVWKKHHFTEGNFFVVAPDSVDVDRLLKFEIWIPDVDHSAAVQLLAKVIKEFTTSLNCTALLYDFINRVSDPDWEEYKFKDLATTYNSEVYWELKGPDTSEDEVEELISDWSSYFPVSAFFCGSPSPDRKKSLTERDFEYLANNLIGVAVDAFDGDSFLIWWREDLQPFPTIEIA
jgi:hypothetical protein